MKHKITKIENDLKAAQNRPIQWWNIDLSIRLEKDLEELLHKHDTYWRSRAENVQIKEGDTNTRFFHQKASCRRRQNKIIQLTDDHGHIKTNQEDLNKIIIDLYSKLFFSDGTTNIDSVIASIPMIITPNINEELLKPFTEVEFRRALKTMQPLKALEPDGIHALFYQRYWNLLSTDIPQFLNDVWSGKEAMSSINMTHVALLAKVDNPTHVKDFWPISLCNVIYKILSKAIVLRLKNILIPLFLLTNLHSFIIVWLLITC